MKALKTILFVAAVSTLVVSCKKERTCECTYTSTSVTTGNNTTVTNTSSSTDKAVASKLSKKDGRRYLDCFNYTRKSSSTNSGFVTETTTEQVCTLK